MIRALSEKELSAAIELIWDTFLLFEAPAYSEEGIRSFRAFLRLDLLMVQLREEKMSFFGAFKEEKLVGVLALRGEQHLSLLFVSRETMRQGIGTALLTFLQQRLSEAGFFAVTVKSSPYAVPFYHHIGFVDTGSEQVQEGIRCTPMCWSWEVLPLRPHHGMCIQHFIGKGYSEGFVENMWCVVNALQEKPSPLISLHSVEDVLCAHCPHHQGGCASGQKVAQLDQMVLYEIGLPAETVLPWSHFQALVRQKILAAGKFEQICKSCEWFATCQEIRKNGEKI